MSILDTNITVLQVNKDTIDKPFEVGYKGDHNAYKLVFSDLVGDGYSVLFWKPMSKHCIAFPLVNNEWLLGNEVLSTSGTLYCQVVKKEESNNFIKHSQVFMLSVNESAPCTQQAFEEVPPNFKIAYDEMVAITKKVNEALTSGKFNGLSAYELAVKNGFEGTEEEWIESLKYWNSPEFTKLAEQVRADKEHVDTVVAKFDTKANQANTDFDAKVDTANTEFDKKVADANNAFDEKVKTANDAFDKKVTDADTNFTGKVNKANTDLDTKVTQINQDLDAKETTINKALDAKITEANSVIDTNVQESATSAENAKQSELKAQSIADNMQGLTNAFRIDTSEQGRVITATDSSESVINGLKVFGESTQVQTTGINLFNQEDLLNTDSPNYDKSQGGSGLWFYKVEVKGSVVVSIATTTTTTNYYLNVSATPNINGVIGWLAHKTSADKKGYIVVNNPSNNVIYLGVNNNIDGIKGVLEATQGIMICDGTVAKPFEPFTDGKPSPSPEYPQEIVSKTVNEITITGSNLFDVSKITDIWTDGYGIKNNNGILTVVTSATSSLSVNTKKLKEVCPSLKPGDTCVFNAISTGSKKAIYLSESNTLWEYKKPLIVTEPMLESHVRFYVNDKINDSGTIRNIQINDGNITLPYELYEQQKVTLSKPITLNGIPVNSNDNVTIDGKQYISDVIVEKDGVYGIERNIHTSKTMYTLGFKYQSTLENNNTFYLYNVENKKYNYENLMCNKLMYLSACFAKDKSYVFCGHTTNKNIYVNLPKNIGVETVEDFEQWLIDNQIEFIYQLDTPTFEPLPEADQQAIKALKSNYPTTVVTNDDSAFMQLDYVADTKNYIDNRLSEIKTAIIASKGV